MQVKGKLTLGFVPCKKRCSKPTVYISLFCLQSDAGIFHLFQIHWKSTPSQLCFHSCLQTWPPKFLKQLFSCFSSILPSLPYSSRCFRCSLHDDSPLALVEEWQVKWLARKLEKQVPILTPVPRKYLHHSLKMHLQKHMKVVNTGTNFIETFHLSSHWRKETDF